MEADPQGGRGGERNAVCFVVVSVDIDEQGEDGGISKVLVVGRLL